MDMKAMIKDMKVINYKYEFERKFKKMIEQEFSDLSGGERTAIFYLYVDSIRVFAERMYEAEAEGKTYEILNLADEAMQNLLGEYKLGMCESANNEESIIFEDDRREIPCSTFGVAKTESTEQPKDIKEDTEMDYMKNSNLNINENCIQCGSCLGCGFDFLNSADDGTINVCPGTILKAEGEEIRVLKEVCPVDAFELSKTEDEESVLDNLLRQLKTHQGIPKPIKEQFKFNKDDYNIPIPFASGENRYEYSSSNAAERAALSEFERAMYSQINTIILRVITEYRIKMVKPFYSGLEEEGSVYAASNKKVSEILRGIKNIMGDKLPGDFAEVCIIPDRDTLDIWKMLNKGELISNELVSTVRNEFEYPSSQYDCYWTWDDMEVCVGTDWRGNLKYKDKYCYRDIYKAFRELAKDLLNACGWAHDDLEDAALRHADWLVRVYNERLMDCINQKIKMVEQIR